MLYKAKVAVCSDIHCVEILVLLKLLKLMVRKLNARL